MIRILLTLTLCLLKVTAFSYYEYNGRLEKAYSAILSLHFHEAEGLLSQELAQHPDNNLSLLYSGYIDFFKAFISEDKQLFEALKANGEARWEILEKTGDEHSPFHLYVKAQLLIQRALVRIKFEENIAAATEIRKAFKLITRNQEKFPFFLLNQKTAGFLHAIVGSVPPKFSWVLKLAGMNGSVSQGISELQSFYELSQHSPYREYRTEALFYMGSLFSALSAPSFQAKETLKNLQELSGTSPLITYVYCNILMKQGRNEEALESLNHAIVDSNAYSFVFLRYKRGLARLRKLDMTADADFHFYLEHFRGRSNIKSSYQKLAWIALLNGDTATYRNYLNNILSSGALMIDEDKDAQYEAENLDMPNKRLLESRLLFDGGYYSQALSSLVGDIHRDFPNYRDQLELTYRMGRILQMMGQTDKAIRYYETTIKIGSSSPYYFAANSSLMLGMIEEERMEMDKAKHYYKQCLDMEYEQYKNSIDQKAQAGLDRLRMTAENK